MVWYFWLDLNYSTNADESLLCFVACAGKLIAEFPNKTSTLAWVAHTENWGHMLDGEEAGQRDKAYDEHKRRHWISSGTGSSPRKSAGTDGSVREIARKTELNLVNIASVTLVLLPRIHYLTVLSFISTDTNRFKNLLKTHLFHLAFWHLLAPLDIL